MSSDIYIPMKPSPHLGNKHIHPLNKLGRLFCSFWSLSMSFTDFSPPLFLIGNRLQDYRCSSIHAEPFFSCCIQDFHFWLSELWLDVIFAFILFGVYWAYWISRLMFYMKFGKSFVLIKYFSAFNSVLCDSYYTYFCSSGVFKKFPEVLFIYSSVFKFFSHWIIYC